MMERWKKISFNEKFEVSDQGRIRRGEAILNQTNSSPSPSGKIYKMVSLEGKYFKVHRIVCEHWVENPNGYKDIKFKDGNTKNPNSSNLEYVSKGASMSMQGKVPKGRKSPNYGVKASSKTKHRMRLAKTGEKHPKFKGYYICDGFKFTSLNAAAKKFKISPYTVKKRVFAVDKEKDFKAWFFKPKKA